jgi:hypothetical protein
MSWEQLRSIYRQNAEEQAYWASQPPRACPNDGTPLLDVPPGREGTLFCPHDGWTYPRDWDENTMAGM